jgi:hypothetical protein
MSISVSDLSTIADGQRPLPWFELWLPLPPSVNRFMGKLGNKSPIVKAWIKEADACYWTRHSIQGITHIIGPYELQIEFGRNRADLSNRIKVLEDWLQRVQIIQNDKLCERLEVTWGLKGNGCTVRVRPWLGGSP